MKDAASTAYAKVCAPYHTWAVRTAVCAGMYALPTREQLLERMKENGQFFLSTFLVKLGSDSGFCILQCLVLKLDADEIWMKYYNVWI